MSRDFLPMRDKGWAGFDAVRPSFVFIQGISRPGKGVQFLIRQRPMDERMGTIWRLDRNRVLRERGGKKQIAINRNDKSWVFPKGDGGMPQKTKRSTFGLILAAVFSRKLLCYSSWDFLWLCLEQFSVERSV